MGEASVESRVRVSPTIPYTILTLSKTVTGRGMLGPAACLSTSAAPHRRVLGILLPQITSSHFPNFLSFQLDNLSTRLRCQYGGATNCTCKTYTWSANQ